jgi:hypothetical protein
MGIQRSCRQHAITSSAVSGQIVRCQIDKFEASRIYAQARHLLSQGPIADRPWSSMGYGLGLMIDLKSPLGLCYGHTGTGPGSTTATYMFGDLPIARTISVFAAVDDEGAVERDVLSLADRFNSVPDA